LTRLFDTNEVRKKFVAYTKDEGYKLNIITSTLKSAISCDVLGLEESFWKICFGHAFLKTCQYAITYEKSLQRFKVYIYQSCLEDLQKCWTWPKRSGKGKQECKKGCVDWSVPQGNWIFQWGQDKLFIFVELLIVYTLFLNSCQR